MNRCSGQIIFVTPYAGVWIEIYPLGTLRSAYFVTPYAGVWIEIVVSASPVYDFVSLPTRECGLKLKSKRHY